ncbi:MAG: hypothetical protein ABI867_39095 [Kofleriaceae bacterium]
MRILVLVVLLAACEWASADRPVTTNPAPVPCALGELCVSEIGALANCSIVAEYAASKRLGNYAAQEDRAPVVSTYQRSCRAHRIEVVEARCIEHAIGVWEMTRCAPRMFADLIAGEAECAAAVTTLVTTTKTLESSPSLDAWVARVVDVYRTSCHDDRWPVALARCVRDHGHVGDYDLMRCYEYAPAGLRTSIAARIAALR